MFKFYNDLQEIEQRFNQLNTIELNQNIPIVFIWHWTDAIKYIHVFKIHLFYIMYRHLKTEVSGSAYCKEKIWESRNCIVIYGNTKRRHVGSIEDLIERNRVLKRILLRVLLHEARHQYQYLEMKDWFYSVTVYEREDDANQYANNLVDNLT